MRWKGCRRIDVRGEDNWWESSTACKWLRAMYTDGHLIPEGDLICRALPHANSPRPTVLGGTGRKKHWLGVTAGHDC